MKRRFKLLLEKWFSGFLPYQAVVGGIRYYHATRENRCQPEQFLHCGKNVRIEAAVGIAAPERLYLGDNVGISQRCYINAVGGCHLGRGCQVGEQTIILTTEHQYNGGESLPYDSVRLIKPVFIEDFVWIGARVAIIPGIRIGEGAIIGMGSVVVHDVPPLAIVSGNPAQILTYRLKADFDRVKREGTVIDPFKELPLLKVPPITRRKYENEIKEMGFDISSGGEYFFYDKTRAPGKRLVAVDEKGHARSRDQGSVATRGMP